MSDPGIEVSASFLQPRPQWPGHGYDTSVLVASADDEVAARALYQAALRFRYVDQHGREHANDDAVDAAVDVEPDLDWPSDVAGVWMTPLGPTVVMDWQGSGWPLANATMTRILIDELRAAGIKQAVIQPLPDELSSVYGTARTFPLP
jgi:hypothetical protein